MTQIKRAPNGTYTCIDCKAVQMNSIVASKHTCEKHWGRHRKHAKQAHAVTEGFYKQQSIKKRGTIKEIIDRPNG